MSSRNGVHPGVLAVTLALALSQVVATPTRAFAQETVQRPVLGGHTFLEHTLFPGAFVQTSMRTKLGIGRALNIETIPPITVDTFDFGGKRGDLYFATLGLAYEHAIMDWVSLGAQFAVTGRLGDGANTILAQGATMAVSFDLAGKFRLYEGESTSLSTAISVKKDNVTAIDFRSWVAGLLEDEDVPLVSKRPSTRVGLDLRGAWAPTAWIGVQGYGGLSRGKNLEVEQETHWYTSYAGSVDFDLLSVSPVPMGLALGGRRDTFPRAANDLAKAVYGGLVHIAYTGRKDFVVGVDLEMDRIPLRDGESLKAGSFQLTTRYYF